MSNAEELLKLLNDDPELLELLARKAEELKKVKKPVNNKAPFNKEQQAVYDAWIKANPYKYIIPEPPRGNIIRLYNKLAVPPFIVVGPEDYEWRSLARVLNTELDYWNKTPMSDEHLWLRGLWMFLVPPDCNKYFEAAEEYTHVGPALFVEDTHDVEAINDARGRTQDMLDELMRRYEDKLVLDLAQVDTPAVTKKSRGRPKGSKNKKKVIKETNNNG